MKNDAERKPLPEPIALGRRFVACRSWEWLDGMATTEGNRLTGDGWLVTESIDQGPSGVVDVFSWSAKPPPEAVPDVTDAATLGCFLELVRRSHNDPTICVVWVAPGMFSGPNVMRVKISSAIGVIGIPRNHDLRTEPGGPFLSEAEALLAALESAP